MHVSVGWSPNVSSADEVWGWEEEDELEIREEGGQWWRRRKTLCERDDENTHVQTLNGHIYSLKYLFVIFKWKITYKVYYECDAKPLLNSRKTKTCAEQGKSRSNWKHINTESREKTQQTNVTERQEQEELKGPEKSDLTNLSTKAREWRHEMTKTQPQSNH